MKLKFELEVEHCMQCPFFRTTGGCYSVRACYDGTEEQRIEKFEGIIMQEAKLPCEIRPCPCEVTIDDEIWDLSESFADKLNSEVENDNR